MRFNLCNPHRVLGVICDLRMGGDFLGINKLAICKKGGVMKRSAIIGLIAQFF